MKYFEKNAVESREDIRRNFRNAEVALAKNQKKEMKLHSIIGAGIGGGAGTALGKANRIIGGAIGAGLGLFGGAVSGAVKGSKGSKADEIRKKYFGTSNLEAIRKLQKATFSGPKDFYGTKK